MIVTVDTNSISIGWTIDPNDLDGKRFSIRFGAKILIEQHRAYLQVQMELLSALTILKLERNYLIGASIMLKVIGCYYLA